MSHTVRNIELMNSSRLVLLATLVIALFAVVSCSSETNSESAESVTTVSESDDQLLEISRVFAPEKIFTFENFVTAGWKKSKQYDTETVAEANGIWYGFYHGRDIELRFYDSYDVASTVGFSDAAEVIDLSSTTKVARNAAGGSASTKYKAFTVVGNTVMLCELAIESCIALVDALDVGTR